MPSITPQNTQHWLSRFEPLFKIFLANSPTYARLISPFIASSSLRISLTQCLYSVISYPYAEVAPLVTDLNLNSLASWRETHSIKERRVPEDRLGCLIICPSDHALPKPSIDIEITADGEILSCSIGAVESSRPPPAIANRNSGVTQPYVESDFLHWAALKAAKRYPYKVEFTDPPPYHKLPPVPPEVVVIEDDDARTIIFA